MRKQTEATDEETLVTLSVRVPRATADRLKVIADGEYRPVAAELRRLIQERVDEKPVDEKPDLLDAA